MTDLTTVCMIVDLEGFHLSARQGRPKEFVVRELGWCVWPGLGSMSCGFKHYYPKDKYHRLPLRDRRTVNYVRDHIHGLSYDPSRKEHARSQGQVTKDLQELYKTYSTPERNRVAYKGGHVEKDLLAKLGIPSLDLETVGCPKFESLNRLTTVGSCGHHLNPLRHHCPRVECYHFMQWLRKTLRLPYDFHFVNLERACKLL